MARIKQNLIDGDWVDAVVLRSGKNREAVERFIADHGLHESTSIPRPVDIMIRHVSFDGVKDLNSALKPFTFEWSDLGPGLWLIGSGRNGRGKTSLVEIVRWLLRGSMPKELPKTVRSWLNNASLTFDVGGVRHHVTVHKTEPFSAKLTRLEPGGSETVIFDVTSDTMFEASMGDFMVGALQLEAIPIWRSGRGASPEGRPVLHGWPALFGAFHIGIDYTALLGELKMDGMQHRLLGMFAGFRHAPLVTSIFIANKEVEQSDQTGERIQQAVAQHAQTRCKSLEAELDEVKKRLKGSAGVAETLATAGAANSDLADLYSRLPGLRSLLSQSRVDTEQTKEVYDADRLALQDFVDANAAHRVFRALSPTCCPRCEQAFDEARKTKEQDLLACMVCGGDAPTDEKIDTADVKRALEEQIKASRELMEEARAIEKDALDAVSKVEAQIAELQRKIVLLTEKQRVSKVAVDLIREQELLEARLADARADAGTGEKHETSSDAAIAKACDDIARARLMEEQKETLAEVGQEMLRLLKAFGMTAVEQVELGAGGGLTVRDGGTENSFGDLSAGNKLRAKVAAVLSLMIVATRRGIGRHPGLLFIDTPGNQELRDADLKAFASGLASIAAQIPTLQVFIATTMVEQFNTAVPDGHRKVATGDDTLW